MKLQLDENNLIIAYVEVGGLSGNIARVEQYTTKCNEETGEETKELTGLVPEDFQDNFKPLFYKFDGEKVVLNEDYKEPEILTPQEPSGISLQERVDNLEEENASLWYEKMMADTRIESNEQEVALLWYELMTTTGGN